MSGAVIGDTHPVARKPHQCGYCLDIIPPGQRYTRWAWASDGGCSTVRAHIACNAVASDYYDKDTDPEERYVSDEALQEWARDRADVRGDLSALAGRTPGWPDGEADRLAAWMAK